MVRESGTVRFAAGLLFLGLVAPAMGGEATGSTISWLEIILEHGGASGSSQWVVEMLDELGTKPAFDGERLLFADDWFIEDPDPAADEISMRWHALKSGFREWARSLNPRMTAANRNFGLPRSLSGCTVVISYPEYAKHEDSATHRAFAEARASRHAPIQDCRRLPERFHVIDFSDFEVLFVELGRKFDERYARVTDIAARDRVRRLADIELRAAAFIHEVEEAVQAYLDDEIRIKPLSKRAGTKAWTKHHTAGDKAVQEYLGVRNSRKTLQPLPLDPSSGVRVRHRGALRWKVKVWLDDDYDIRKFDHRRMRTDLLPKNRRRGR